MNIQNLLNRMDCTFYFIINDKNKNVVLKQETQRRICEKFESVMGIRFYGMRSGPDVRSALKLQKEFAETIPEQVDVILVDKEKNNVTLLSQKERNEFFQAVIGAKKEMDTLTLVQHILKENDDA